MTDDLWNEFQREKRRARELLDSTVVTRESPHTTFMNECVPAMMTDNGAPIEQAVAACLTMWEQEWERTHPGGEVDPSKADRTLMLARLRLRGG